MPKDPNRNAPKFLAEKYQRLGAELLHHQCWCFGKDVRFDGGNLLIRYGFERFQSPLEADGSTAYRFQIDPERALILWGFGVFYRENRNFGIYLHRYKFIPQVIESNNLKLPIWKSEQLAPRRFPQESEEIRRTGEVTANLSDFIVGYETWISENAEKGWRKRCLKEWRLTRLSPSEIVKGWQKLSKICRKFAHR